MDVLFPAVAVHADGSSSELLQHFAGPGLQPEGEWFHSRSRTKAWTGRSIIAVSQQKK